MIKSDADSVDNVLSNAVIVYNIVW